jgi:hypothetical protein
MTVSWKMNRREEGSVDQFQDSGFELRCRVKPYPETRMTGERVVEHIKKKMY